jgi:hypothetical protein
MQQPDENTRGGLPERERVFVSGRLGIDSIELGQQLTTKQAELIIEELLEADREYRRTPVEKPEVYRPRFRRGD